MLLAIDPGDTYSAYVLYDEKEKTPVEFDKIPNDEMLKKVYDYNKKTDQLALEMIASYGMSVGATVFDTCVWIGRFWEAWKGNVTQVYRREVKMHICQTMRAKDGNVRQAIIDLYPKTGQDSKGNPCARGTKKNPGPLYGMSKDCWAAMGVAITFAETRLQPSQNKL